MTHHGTIKRKTRNAKHATRTCVRCGCTDARACADGCVWMTPRVDICSACIQDHEHDLFAMLLSLDHCREAIQFRGVDITNRLYLAVELDYAIHDMVHQLKTGKRAGEKTGQADPSPRPPVPPSSHPSIPPKGGDQ